jgi:predicted lipase
MDDAKEDNTLSIPEEIRTWLDKLVQDDIHENALFKVEVTGNIKSFDRCIGISYGFNTLNVRSFKLKTFWTPSVLQRYIKHYIRIGLENLRLYRMISILRNDIMNSHEFVVGKED